MRELVAEMTGMAVQEAGWCREGGCLGASRSVSVVCGGSELVFDATVSTTIGEISQKVNAASPGGGETTR